MSVREAASPDDAGLLFVGERLVGRGRKALAAYLSGRYAYRTGKQAFETWRRLVTFTISVPGDDDLFPEIQRWILEQLPVRRRRALLVRSKRRYDEDQPSLVEGPRGRPTAEARFYFDGDTEQTISLEGFRVKVALVRPPEQTIILSEEGASSFQKMREKIVFTCWSEGARVAVERFLAATADRFVDRSPRLYVANAWQWNRQARNGVRPLDTVVLARGQKERLVADLEKFLDSEPEYLKLGIPWHRGYLFHGSAGTGKTSTAKALADHFGLDAYYLPLPVIQDDARLVDMLNSVGSRALLVLEDVDIVHGARVRDDTARGVTLSGLLNALDGLVTPHGLVTVMTTNHLETLDDALVRPGRVDVREEMGLLDGEQLDRLVEVLVPGGVRLWKEGRERRSGAVTLGLAPAAVVEAVKANLGHPGDTVRAIERLVRRGARMTA